MNSTKFVSYFRIEGKPILPPVMTKEKRDEMSNYRRQAILLENVLKERKSLELLARSEANQSLQSKMDSLQRSPSQALNLQGGSEADSEATVENDYLKVSNLYRQPHAKKDRNMQLDLSPLHLTSVTAANLQQSDIYIYDVVANTLTNSMTEEDDGEEDAKRSTSSSNSVISMISNNAAAMQNSKTFCAPHTISVPTIEVNPPTPIVTRKDLVEDIVEPQPTTTNSSENPLIRSSSFTLENPSTALLQHINRQNTVQRRKSTATNDTIESKAKKVTKSPLMVSASAGNMGLRVKRSPYESRSSKITRKKVSNLSKCRNTSKTSVDPLKNVEESHRQKFLELLKKQKEEQRELQKNFEIQQQRLMDELTKEMCANKLVSKSPVSEVESSPTFRKSYSDSSEIEKKTPPRRKLFASSQSPSPPVISVAKRREIEYNAATKINAYVRGYLTRRLFETYFVQDICKSIKQCLQYLFKLHTEIGDNDTAETTTIKIILLKRISKTCTMLHNVFYEVPMKDRMDLIALDRKQKRANISHHRLEK